MQLKGLEMSALPPSTANDSPFERRENLEKVNSQMSGDFSSLPASFASFFSVQQVPPQTPLHKLHNLHNGISLFTDATRCQTMICEESGPQDLFVPHLHNAAQQNS